ncbi:MAG: hypothetical protein GYB66_02775 [Chloroflexi bacterium]|nr:hypothetical protein [Chloroflexota bacterium]
MTDLPTGPELETPLSKLRFQRHLRVFPVFNQTTTVYVRGSNCRVAVLYHELNQVELYASFYAAFGLKLIVDQDEAGIYIVAQRRRLLGLFSRSEVTIRVPFYCHLVFSLTPGTVRVEELNGHLEIPPINQEAVSVVETPFKKVAGQDFQRISSGEQPNYFR